MSSVTVIDQQGMTVDVDYFHGLAEWVLADQTYPARTVLSINLISDRLMSEYQQKFMDREGPTDVLAFPLQELEPKKSPKLEPAGPPLLLGDVMLAPSYIKQQTQQQGAQLRWEIGHRLVHGMLHLMGYDHAEPAEAKQMYQRQEELLSRYKPEDNQPK